MTDNRTDEHTANKLAVAAGLQNVFSSDIAKLNESVSSIYADDVTVNAFHPVNELEGAKDVADALWRPLRIAFPNMERRDQIVVAGSYEGKDFVCAMTFLQGVMREPWLDVPPTHEIVSLRCCEIHEVADSRIVESHVLIDTLDFLRQVGFWPIAPSLGTEAPWAGPMTGDGVLHACDFDRGQKALKLVKAMHAGLGKFDGKDLKSMDHARYWEPGFMWYGPSGIGTSKGLSGFEAHHQIPFLRAFPDRRLNVHVANICDGDYVVTGGWPSVIGTHSGPDWLGLGPTGREVHFRVMDFYRVSAGFIAENWVPIDIADVLRQLGVDVFARVRHFAGKPREQL